MEQRIITARDVRRGLLQLINDQPYTHALTLNTDRELSLRRIRGVFGTFCMKLDREILGTQRPASLPASLRLNAIAFPEHLGTNAHLHVLADFSALMTLWPYQCYAFDLIRCCWLQSTRGAGSIDVKPLRDNGYSRYALKNALGRDPVFFLARDFHPQL